MGKDEPRLEDFTDYTEDMAKYFKLLKEDTENYEGCPKGITELSLVAELLHLKQLNVWTNSSFTMLLELLKTVFLNSKIPKSFYQANKLLMDLRGRTSYAQLKEEVSIYKFNSGLHFFFLLCACVLNFKIFIF